MMSTSCVRPSAVLRMAVQRNIFRSGTSCGGTLYGEMATRCMMQLMHNVLTMPQTQQI